VITLVAGSMPLHMLKCSHGDRALGNPIQSPESLPVPTMNETIVSTISTISTISIVIAGVLLLWKVASITLSPRSGAKGRGRRMRVKHFTSVSIEKRSVAKQGHKLQALEMPARAPQLVVEHAQSVIHDTQTVDECEVTQLFAPTSLDTDVEQPVQRTQTQSFRGRNLCGVRLRGKNLAGADLSHCNLVRADLAEADLRGASLAYSDLTCAILVGADLSGCDCTGARFHGANLQDAKLNHSDLTNTRFGPTIRHWAEVYSCHTVQSDPWRTVHIVGANLRGIYKVEAKLAGSDLVRGRVDDRLYWTQWTLPQFDAQGPGDV
jgi:hypothetical protein